MDFEPVNWKLIAHPINWVVILLMVVIAGAIGHLTLTYIGINPSTAENSGYADAPAGQTPGQASTAAISPQSVNPSY